MKEIIDVLFPVFVILVLITACVGLITLLGVLFYGIYEFLDDLFYGVNLKFWKKK